MDNLPHVLFPLSDRSYVSLLKKDIKKIAEQIGFDAKRLAEIAIIVSEIASNLIKHTKGGSILVKHVVNGESEGIEIISIDNGPGMLNPAMMLKDGVSTTNTLGQGLGAIKRLSDNFDIYSVPKWGTILLSRVFTNTDAKDLLSKEIFISSTIMVSKNGEEFCGDGYKILTKKNTCQILAFDGLGHGPEAQKANEAAVKSFTETKNLDTAEKLKVMHRSIRHTRGGVGMAFSIDLKNQSLSYCGVGNISARVLSEGRLKSCISHNGIVGHTFPNSLKSNSISYGKEDFLIITSDGITSRWDVGALANILKHDIAIVTAGLYKDFCRGNDDSLVMIVKCNRKVN